MKIFTAAAVLLLAATALAQSGPLPGLDAYMRGEYAAAARQLSTAISSKKLTPEDAAKARMFLAASYSALGNMVAVESTLHELFREAPDARVDPNIFDPDLVALSEQIRAQEDEKRLAESVRKEAEARMPPASSVVVKDPPEPDAEASAVELRVGLFALSDLAPLTERKPAHATGALTVSALIQRFEAGLRVLPGHSWGIGADAGYLFGSGSFAPRLGARFTLYPSLVDGAGVTGAGFGVGAVLGVRYNVLEFLALAADVSGELNRTPDETIYNGYSLVLAGGAQYIF